MNKFGFTHEPIDVAQLAAPLAAASAGGYAGFEGRVRDHNEGRAVTGLEYETFEELAVAEGCRIVEAAIARHGILRARCMHRVGRLAVGDVAVWVGVSARHRAEAFAACREIIDAVKHRLPIWKKEHYASGASAWVNCDHGAVDAGIEPSVFDYSRQVALPEVGLTGQARLASASVVVVGAGGLGCAVLPGLAGAGIGTISIVDPDLVQASNLHRQPLYDIADIGRPKAEAAARRLSAYNPAIRILPCPVRLDAANADRLIAGCDVVVDCTDNFAAKFLVNDAAVRNGKPAVIASVYQYEGQLQVVRPEIGGSCLRCQWPEATRDGLVGNCEQTGVLGPVPAVLGSLQAMEVLKLLLDLPGQLSNEVLLVDLLANGLKRLGAARNPRCLASCVRVGQVEPERLAEDVDVSISLAAAASGGYRIIDIREPDECEDEPLPLAGQQALPLGRLLEGTPDLAPGDRYLLVCAHGVRSHAAAEYLRSRGFGNVWSLHGGLAAQRGSPGQNAN
jgi:adenylyltransferase/sulfurtransferase